MSILIWRLLIDFGLVILIWMIQLIVYPSFVRFTEKDLMGWHSSYSERITIIVLPLMVSQLGLIMWQIVTVQSFYSLASALLVSVVWAFTFFQAVPLHNKIQNGVDVKQSVQRLVKANWNRTIIWTLLFIGSLLKVIL
jgi:hypothetical protein